MKNTLLLLLLLGSLTSFSQSTENLVIKFNQEINKGNLLVYIYNKAKGFPKRKDLAYKTLIIKANHTQQISITDLPYSTYAIIIVHDKNGNQKMDKNWVGMPGEPYAISGNPPFRMGPPKFKDVSFYFSIKNKILLMKF